MLLLLFIVAHYTFAITKYLNLNQNQTSKSRNVIKKYTHF